MRESSNFNPKEFMAKLGIKADMGNFESIEA